MDITRLISQHEVKEHFQESDDFGVLLDEFNIKYSTIDYYLHVGDVYIEQGWMLHISVIRSQVFDLLHNVIPLLLNDQICFRIPKNINVASSLVDGAFGYANLGKIVCIYPNSDLQALELAEKLANTLKIYKGPAIPTDFCIAPNLYTRYGGFYKLERINNNGEREQYVRDSMGNLIPDYLTVPPTIPEGVKWPFFSLSSPNTDAFSDTIKQTYKVVQVIKSDAKGKVIKACRIRHLVIPQWAVVKEGKQCMCMDEHGRDIKNRLIWQYELHRDLSNVLPVPKPLEIFEEGDNTYFSMQFVRGVSLENYIAGMFDGSNWGYLPLKRKIKLIESLQKVIKLVQLLHQKGYIHRDITPANFLVDKNEKHWLIDLELAYSSKRQHPSPPFKLGSDGFMSPEQIAGNTPTIKEDIYGLGALMITYFTNFLPTKFEQQSQDLLIQQLNHFIGHNKITSIIASCFSPDTIRRPDTTQLLEAIYEYKNLITKNKGRIDTSHIPLQLQETRSTDQIIRGAIAAVNSDLMIGSHNLWLSRSDAKEQQVSNLLLTRSTYVGFQKGISGILFLLARLQIAGFPIDKEIDHYTANLDFIKKSYIPNLRLAPSGLFNGAAGIAVAIAEGIKSGLVDDLAENRRIIESCLDVAPVGLDIEHGAAGLGLAILSCAPYIDGNIAYRLAKRQADLLVKSQNNDGSWTPNATMVTSSTPVDCSLVNGVAGITNFLLSFFEKYTERDVAYSAEKALNFLSLARMRSAKGYIWINPQSRKPIPPWLNEGTTGIALAFLRGYEVLGHQELAKLGEGILREHPKHLTTQLFEYGRGITGIAEVYLEAYRILNNNDWEIRAQLLKNTLSNCFRFRNDREIYWLPDSVNIPTADFMAGNGGILHFLLRSIRPGQFKLPLFT